MVLRISFQIYIWKKWSRLKIIKSVFDLWIISSVDFMRITSIQSFFRSSFFQVKFIFSSLRIRNVLNDTRLNANREIIKAISTRKYWNEIEARANQSEKKSVSQASFAVCDSSEQAQRTLRSIVVILGTDAHRECSMTKQVVAVQCVGSCCVRFHAVSQNQADFEQFSSEFSIAR